MSRIRSFTTTVCAAALIAGGAFAATVPGATSAGAATTTVSNTADDGTATSLRGVLETANDGDVLELVPGATYELTLCITEVDVDPQFLLHPGELLSPAAVTIDGNG